MEPDSLSSSEPSSASLLCSAVCSSGGRSGSSVGADWGSAQAGPPCAHRQDCWFPDLHMNQHLDSHSWLGQAAATHTCRHALLRLYMRSFNRLAPTSCRRVDLCHGLRARLRALLSKLPGRFDEGTRRFAACSPHAVSFAVSGHQVQDSAPQNALSHARPKV